MNIHESLKNEGKSRKNYKPRRGMGMIYPALLGPFKFMPNRSVGPSECETKFTLKYFDMGHVKMHGFHLNPYTIFKNGGGGGGVGRRTNSIISRVLLISEH